MHHPPSAQKPEASMDSRSKTVARSYLQAYSKEIIPRIAKRENLIRDPYKEGFRNLATLLVSPDMPLDEAEPLLHLIAVMNPEKRRGVYKLLCGPLSTIINRHNSRDILQTMLSNPIPTNDEALACKEAICKLIRQDTPEALKTQIIKALYILSSKYPERFEYIEELAKYANEVDLMVNFLKLMSKSTWTDIIDSHDFAAFLELFKEIHQIRALDLAEYKSSAKEKLLVIDRMLQFPSEKRTDISEFAKKWQISLKTLLLISEIYVSDWPASYKELFFIEQMMPEQMDDRFIRAMIDRFGLSSSKASQCSLEKLEKIKSAILLLISERPNIDTGVFEKRVEELMESNEDPEGKVKSWLALSKKDFKPNLEMQSPLHEPLPCKAKVTGCPFQHTWGQSTFSNDPLAIQEALELHRFEKELFRNPFSSESGENSLRSETSVIGCSPSDTPRYRQIFFDLLLNKKRERGLQSIIEDHLDKLCNTSCQDMRRVALSMVENLQKIASCVLDEIPIKWQSNAAVEFDIDKLLESQLYQDLLNAGYKHQEIVTNFSMLAGVIVGNGETFLMRLLKDLELPESKKLLTTIGKDLQKLIKNDGDIWKAIKKVKEIDQLIIESLRLSFFLPPIRRELFESKNSLDVLPNTLAMKLDLVGENPQEFRPSRLVEGTDQQISQHWPSAIPWMPFGHGTHLCPAWKLYQIMGRYLVAKTALRSLNDQPMLPT